jgi:hypothetical protein
MRKVHTFPMRFKVLVNTHNLPKNSFIIYISFIIQKKSKLKKKSRYEDIIP